MLQRALKQLEAMRLQLAEFFCEDMGTFKMEECFKIFHNFSEKFQHAVKDNEKRRVQEEQALIRRKQREETLRRRQCKASEAGRGKCPVASYYTDYFSCCSESTRNARVRFGG